MKRDTSVELGERRYLWTLYDDVEPIAEGRERRKISIEELASALLISTQNVNSSLEDSQKRKVQAH